MLATQSPAKPFSEMFPGKKDEYSPEAVTALSQIDYKTGKATVGNNLASFDLGDKFYFLNPIDSNYVLTEIWGNPPSDDTLGMIFPADKSPIDEGWGIVVSFEDIGYVDDKDAAKTDFDDLLKTMKQDVRDNNAWRTQNGYPAMELVGWAEPPKYDAEKKQLYWAKDLMFSDSDVDALNYNIRVLGRKGVLNMNFVATIEDLAQVKQAVPDVLAMTTFTEGNRYADFNPSIDKVAAIGIGGLIAGKVLAKTGFLVGLLLLLKKFWVILLIPVIAVKKAFSRKKEES